MLGVKVLAVAFMMALLFSASAVAVHFATVHASTDVSGIPKPSIPEFTLVLVDSSYDVPTTYSIDPYTGENVTHPGYHVENKRVGIKIKNQPFTSYYDDSLGQNINFYYNIRVKGSFSEDWTELYRASDGYPSQDSGSEYTVITFLSETGKTIEAGAFSRTFPDGAQVDYQVEAMIGYTHQVVSDPPHFLPWVFTGEKSGWSETLTITVPISTQLPTITPSPTTTPEPTPPTSPTPTPNGTSRTMQSETIVGAVIAVAVIGAGLGLLVYLIKRK